jgi:hypothetical protein
MQNNTFNGTNGTVVDDPWYTVNWTILFPFICKENSECFFIWGIVDKLTVAFLFFFITYKIYYIITGYSRIFLKSYDKCKTLTKKKIIEKKRIWYKKLVSIIFVVLIFVIVFFIMIYSYLYKLDFSTTITIASILIAGLGFAFNSLFIPYLKGRISVMNGDLEYHRVYKLSMNGETKKQYEKIRFCGVGFYYIKWFNIKEKQYFYMSTLKYYNYDIFVYQDEYDINNNFAQIKIS